ncbi:histidine phosphatase superfamily [Baffinella frigidus]|nr:histidine phosphatase superfamily [Cryptophyta sp. CCMP2293]
MRLKGVQRSCLSLLLLSSAHGWCAAPSMSLNMAKEITFVRHGVTEMNEFLGKKSYGSTGFEDPGYYDTRLTPRGMNQATELNKVLRGEHEEGGQQMELLVASPLHRTLHTATLAFGGLEHIPRVVNPMVRERMWLSSDVGSDPEALQAEFGEHGWDCSALPKRWWYHNDNWAKETEWRAPGKYVHAGEPEAPFRERLQAFKGWLAARPETHITVVSHWGAIYGLTGLSLENCQVARVRLSELREDIACTP